MATLNELKVGQKCVVEDVAVAGDIKRRLMDLGIVKGATVECELISPGGDPKAFYIKGALIALREEETKKILVRVCECFDAAEERGGTDE